MAQKPNKFNKAISEEEALRRQQKPETVGTRLADLSVYFFFELLWANVLFVVFSLPLVTVPAAWCGLHRVVQQYFLHKQVSVFRTFWQEFKSQFAARLSLSAAFLAVMLGGGIIAARQGTVISFAVCAFLVAVVFMLCNWLFPQLVLLNLKPLTALRNAAILMLVETKANLLLLALQMLPLTLTVFLWPVSMFGVIILPVAHVLLSTVVCLPVLQQRLVREETPEKAPETEVR